MHGRNIPRTSGSQKLYNGMLLIVVFGLVLVFFSSVAPSPHDSPQIRQKLLQEFRQRGLSHRPRPGGLIVRGNDGDDNDIGPTPPYHMVFSTSCNDQQHWESFAFFYHAYKVKQPGTVTRICSGCNDKEAQELQEFHDKYIRPLNENFHLHLTPDFASLTKKLGLGEKKQYKYMNKPYGLRHWMENILKMNETDHPPEVDDGIVMLLDPDMILLRPLVHDFRKENVIYVNREPDTKVVKHGYPVAQQDGYLDSRWMTLNISYVTNGGNIDHLKRIDGPTYYNTGPPYLATARDMYKIAVTWCDYAPRVYEIHPKLFAEMYGYIIATTQLNLPHTLIMSIVVSNTETKSREGWQYIDALSNDEICSPPDNAPLPFGLHYCERYVLENFFFNKYRIKKKYISCESPLLRPPPLDLATREHSVAYIPPPHGHPDGVVWEAPNRTLALWQSKREAFMLCALISKINEAALHFKRNYCEGKANMEYYDFFTDPHH